jgi:hypothetical protein
MEQRCSPHAAKKEREERERDGGREREREREIWRRSVFQYFLQEHTLNDLTSFY